jgi:large subunit ribosomal protein L24
MKIKKGDVVAVISGADKPVKGKYKTGKVLRVYPKLEKIVVEGVNIKTKHNRPSQAKPDGGIEKKEAPIAVSNVAILDPVSKKPTKVGYQVVGGKKVRVAKKSGTPLDK